MSKLPSVSGREIVKAMNKLGYEFDRQRGSYIILRQSAAPHRRLTVPDHREVARGTLRSTLREAGVTVDELKGPL